MVLGSTSLIMERQQLVGKKINGAWYYFPSCQGGIGEMCMDGTYLVPNEGKYYTFANDGHWIESGSSSNTNNANSGSWFKSDDDHWQYKLNGQNVTDWQKLDGVWYYFDPTNAWSVTGWQWINGHWYYFDPDGCLMLTGD